MASSPTHPTLAVDIKLLEFARLQFLNMVPNTTGWCAALEAFLTSLGFKLQTRVRTMITRQNSVLTNLIRTRYDAGSLHVYAGTTRFWKEQMIISRTSCRLLASARAVLPQRWPLALHHHFHRRLLNSHHPPQSNLHVYHYHHVQEHPGRPPPITQRVLRSRTHMRRRPSRARANIFVDVAGCALVAT